MSGPRTLHLLYSFACNLFCAHCLHECGPAGTPLMGIRRARSFIDQAAQVGIGRIVLNGGEPLLFPAAMRELVGHTVQNGMACSLISNGYWASSRDRAADWLAPLAEAGLHALTLSTDRYHLQGVALSHIEDAVRAARDLGLETGVKIARHARDPLADGLYRSVRAFTCRVEVQPISPLGRAAHLHPSLFRRFDLPADGPGCGSPPVVLPDGTLLTCCNLPARLPRGTPAPLVLGNLCSEPLHRLLRRRASDPLLVFLRARGPAPLFRRVRTVQKQDGSPPRSIFHDRCDLCVHLFLDSHRSPPVRALTHGKETASASADGVRP